MEVGQIVRGKVTEILRFGANVELENGERAFVHISKIANQYVDKVENFLQVGQEVEGRVIGKGRDGKWEISLKPEEKNTRHAREQRDQMSIENELKKEEFEKKLQKFLKDSQKTYSEYKRRLDKKQGVTKRK